MKNDNLEEVRPLLMGLLDGELSPEEASRVNDALIRSAALREEYEKLRETSGKLESLSMLEPQDEIARKLWRSPHHRLARDGGVWLILGGYGFLILYAIWAMIKEGAAATLPGLAVLAIFLGVAALLFTFIRERIETHKTDPYKDIER